MFRQRICAYFHPSNAGRIFMRNVLDAVKISHSHLSYVRRDHIEKKTPYWFFINSILLSNLRGSQKSEGPAEILIHRNYWFTTMNQTYLMQISFEVCICDLDFVSCLVIVRERSIPLAIFIFGSIIWYSVYRQSKVVCILFRVYLISSKIEENFVNIFLFGVCLIIFYKYCARKHIIRIVSHNR